MQRVPSALAKPAKKLSPATLVPINPVPHAESRGSMPAEWAWDGSLATPAAAPTTATFTPMAYEHGYDYPLIVWLHGDDADERSLPGVMKHVSVRNFVAVAPRSAAEGNSSSGWDQTADTIESAEDAVFAAIESARERFSLHPRRVFLAGSGAGGTMAMRLGLRHPDRFAGVATLDGPLPTGQTPLGRVNEIRQLPLLLSASRQSAGYPEPHVCQDLSLLHSAGCRVAIRQYPGDDDLTDTMLADLNRWAMEIVCG